MVSSVEQDRKVDYLAVAERLIAWTAELEKVGLSIGSFGPGVVVIKRVPACLQGTDWDAVGLALARSLPATAAGSLPDASLTALALLALTGCSSGPEVGRLAQYDFTTGTVAVVTTTPPRPEFFPDTDLDASPADGWLGAAIAVGSEIVKDVQLAQLQPRLDSAAVEADLEGIMSQTLLQECSRVLRARPVDSVSEADYELEARLTRVGITADNPDDNVYLFLEGTVRLLEGPTGAEIWADRLEISESLADGWKQEDYSVTSRVMDDVFTARALSELTVEELRALLEYAAQDTGILIADRLWEAMREVERMAAEGS